MFSLTKALIPKTGYCNISEEDLIILHVSIEGPNKTYEDKHHFALVEKRVITNNIKFATNVHPSIGKTVLLLSCVVDCLLGSSQDA